MQFKMSQNSLFAILLRNPWWVSFAIAIVVVLVARLILPDEYVAYAPGVALPFFATGAMTAWKQLREPSTARVEATLAAIGAMSWRDFSLLMEEAFKRDGHQVTRTSGGADFILMKAGRTALVSCKRWKAASHGVQPLLELNAEREKCGAPEALYVVASTITDNALRFAAKHKISLMRAPELTRLLRLPKGR